MSDDFVTAVAIRSVSSQYLVLPEDAVLITPVERDQLCNEIARLRAERNALQRRVETLEKALDYWKPLRGEEAG